MHSDLTTAPIPRLVRRLAIPAGTGLFFNTMFNVVDTWYGGRLSTAALAAMSLSFPVFFIILSVGTGISSGATALIGNALGRGEREEARHFVLQVISFALLHAIGLTLFGLASSSWFFRLMGAQGEYLTLAVSYMDVIFCGSIFFLFNFVMSAILNSHGDTISYRNFLIGGFLLNLLLDPWFMYGGLGIPALGLPGVALSTIAIQFLGNFYLFGRLKQAGAVTDFDLRELIPRCRFFRELFGQGFPSAMNMFSIAAGIFIITWFVGRFGRDAVAAYGIGTRIEQIALLPVMGLNVATMALTAQNYGAERIDRIRQTLSTALRYGVMIASAGTLAALLFSRELLRLFTSDAGVISAGAGFLRVEALVFPAYVLLYVCISAMQGIKRPGFGLWIGLYRQIVAPPLMFHLLTVTLGWGINGIWWGIFLVTWSAAAIVVLFVTRLLKRLEEDLT